MFIIFKYTLNTIVSKYENMVKLLKGGDILITSENMKNRMNMISEMKNESTFQILEYDNLLLTDEEIKELNKDFIEKTFLLEIERKVSTDCVVQIDKIEFEVPQKYSKKQKCRLFLKPLYFFWKIYY